VLAVQRVQLRWIGHRLHGSAVVRVDPSTTAAQTDELLSAGAHRLGHALPNLEDVTIAVTAQGAR
jgi:divalent metal cation (Fe/Co/Zn/Cd) transporter